ncbi:protein FAR1-RELATED SEQUENCE 5-like [Lactuca sativa]|uniref:protein FAR1-RELATED SEQUENCE 5-like n=1 Tax=Lactuca sativa TaxID=4236 RepID=UPI0022AE95F2|nr:protein FAR1-RELATED SEQUENCE 5-like [Lactuca sativa]
MVNVNTFIAEHTKDANNDEDENHFIDEDIEVNIDYSEGQPHVTHEDTEFNIDFSEGQPHVTHDYVSPGGTLYWTPIVLNDIKPKVSSKFNLYGEAETMYRKYALESGFDVRLGRVQKMKNGIITNRHLVCNREGNPNTSKLDTLDIQHKKTQRRKDLFKRNCKAKVVLEIIPGTLTYVVSDFVERHNHELFRKGNMHLSRSKRKLDYSQEIFIHNFSKQNIGPVKAHRLYSALQVGPLVRGGLVIDFKNARRNLNCYIGGRDAKFLVDNMNDRKKNVPSFTFEYKVSNKRLNSLFWADETAKYNYNSFGDVVSIDATFSMNKYDMVFVPFIGIDNHKKCVTFGAGLLSKEDGVSYEWLLRAFLKAFRKQPQLVLSDQDPALKKAIDKVFPLAHHRLCMWHITKKLPNKNEFIQILSIEDATTNQKFRKRFHSIIWNSKLEPHEFENVWRQMLEEFKITDNTWMNTMYGLRKSWIPAFFKHIPMSDLMRTTSLSESQNWSFQTTTLTGSYLVMFMMTFESVMERQRHNQILNDFNTATTIPKFITRTPYEPHASNVYTQKIFYQVQKEISRSEDNCFQKNVISSNGVDTIIVIEKTKNITIRQTNDVDVDDKDEEYNYDCLIRDIEYTVTHSTKDGSFKCTCMHFEHLGILCRHIFCVFKFYGIEQIPEKYILKRWRRDVIPTELLKRRFNNSFDDSTSDMTAIDIFFQLLTVVHDCPNHDLPTRADHFKKLLGVVGPDVESDVNDIQNPTDIRNKGYGSRGKRLKSTKEMIEKEISKPKRKCATCEQMVHHDKRNCPLKNTKK